MMLLDIVFCRTMLEKMAAARGNGKCKISLVHVTLRRHSSLIDSCGKVNSQKASVKYVTINVN